MHCLLRSGLRRGAHAAIAVALGLAGCGGTGGGAVARDRGASSGASAPAIDERLARTYRAELEACLAMPGPAATEPAFDYPASLLDGFDTNLAPRPEAQLRTEIAHATSLLERARDDAAERESALFVLGRLEFELGAHLEGDAALVLRRSELAHYLALVGEFPESRLAPIASLRAGRIQAALGESGPAVASFTTALEHRHAGPNLESAARVNLSRLAAADGRTEDAIDAIRRSSQNGASQGNPREMVATSRLFVMLGKYHLAWAYRRAGNEERALPAFRETIRGAENGENEPAATAWIAEAAARDICAPWKPASASATPDAAPAGAESQGAHDATPHINLRLLAATDSARARSVSLYAAGVAAPIFDGITFEQAVGYLRVDLGATEYLIRPAGSPDAEPLARIPASAFSPFHAYTAVLFGGAGRTDPFEVEVHLDPAVQANMQSSMLRFFNAMERSDALEICRVRAHQDPEPLFSGAAKGQYGVPHFRDGVQPVDALSNAVELRSSVYDVELQVRAPDATPCAGRLAGTAVVRIDRELNGTIFAVGDYRSRSHRGLWMCAEAPSDTNCIHVELDGR